MTPAPIARFMASLFSALQQREIRLLDPGAGVGSLTAAFVQRACSEPVPPQRIAITAYEIDTLLQTPLQSTLEDCVRVARAAGIELTYQIQPIDFIEHTTEALAGGLFSQLASYTHVITNPPYKKINSQSTHRLLLRSVGIEATNLYAAFVMLAVMLLEPDGEVVAITPRSFCNGPYFLPFRRLLLADMALRRIHTFGARDEAFKDDQVLQENLIYWATKTEQPETVDLSSSHGLDLHAGSVRRAPFAQIVDLLDPHLVIHIPVTQEDTEIVIQMKGLRNSLADIGLAVSTGPVVEFRLKSYIHRTSDAGTVPLIYPAHFQEGYVVWPKANGKKPNALQDNPETRKWLMPQGCYTLTRRFSSKEERRRIFAAVYDPTNPNAARIGFENHLNVFHQQGQGLPPLLARGLALYLNSTIVDHYFRLFNGHTQVNASDLRSLPYPSRATLIALGERAPADKLPTQETVDKLVDQVVFYEPATAPQHRNQQESGMELDQLTTQLTRQAEAIRALVQGASDAQARWKPSPDDWSILEVIHHLYDEEIEDFRRHLDHILYHADQPWPRIDPGGWVTQRRYNEQEPATMLTKFLAARQESLAWLATLGVADWNVAIAMPWGALTAGDILASWAAHDLLHLRQLVELHYAWTQRTVAPHSVEYAGEW